MHPTRSQHLLNDRLTRSIIGAFYDVYNALGYGFLEHVYSAALDLELRNRGHDVAREYAVQVYFKGTALVSQRLDMVVDQRIVIELKATHILPRAASLQLFNYLRATDLEIGLLFHFGPRPEFHRIIATNTRSKSGCT